MNRVFEIVSERAFRHGIKCGLAGILAVFISEVMRLPSPQSALLTVFVLMLAQYIGAISDKAMMRFAGTVVGGVIGYLLCGSLQQNPVIFILLVSGIVGFCSAMYGQARYPYGFYLCGLTILVVCGDGMTNPEHSWNEMLLRVQEIAVGVISALLVQNLLWPRYARIEFIVASRKAFADLADTFEQAAPGFFDRGASTAAKQNEAFLARTAAMRKLLEFGVRESQFFRKQIGTYSGIVSGMNRIAAASLAIDDPLPPGSPYRVLYADAIPKVHAVIVHALRELSDGKTTSKRRSTVEAELAAAFGELETRMEEVRQSQTVREFAPADFLALGQHVLSLEEIHTEIIRVHGLVDALEKNLPDRSAPAIRHKSGVPPLPSAFWIRTGIRCAVVISIALILCNWINMPGAGNVLTNSWVFVCTNNMSPSGRGDSRIFHYAAIAIPILLVLTLGVIALAPLLADYMALNIFIFLFLFGCGFFAAASPNKTVLYQTAALFLCGVIGLNPQEPVHFQQFVGMFFGIALALLLAALVQRLVLPSLPQWEFRERVQEFIGICRKLISSNGAPLPAWQQTRLALIPGEVITRLKHFYSPISPDGETDKLKEYVACLRLAAFQVISTVGRLGQILPEPLREEGQRRIFEVEAELDRHFQAHVIGLQRAAPPEVNPDALRRILSEFDTWMTEVRLWMLTNQYPIHKSIRATGLVGRYHDLGDALILAKSQADQLRLKLYMGDYWL